MKAYHIRSLGYLTPPYDPGFPTLAAARKELAAVVREEKARAKHWSKRAAVVRLGKDRVAIHAMKDTRSPLWCEYEIAESDCLNRHRAA